MKAIESADKGVLLHFRPVASKRNRHCMARWAGSLKDWAEVGFLGRGLRPLPTS